MSLAIRLYPEVLRSVAFGSISGTYAPIGTPFLHPCRILVLQNQTDGLLVISWDGVNDHLPIPAQGYIILDVTTNKTVDIGAFFAQDTQLYVRDLTAPTTGSLYVSTFFGTGVVA